MYPLMQMLQNYLMPSKYVFQVFVTSLNTDKGKELVKQYKNSFDAQSVWRDLLTHMKTSATAKISTGIVCQYITNVKIDDGSWRGTTSAFLTNWTEQVRIYDENVESSAQLSDDAKRQFLENTVQNHPEFCNVKSTEDMITVLGAKCTLTVRATAPTI